MASGGVAVRPTRRVIGEKGPEAVVPLYRAKEFFGGGGLNIGDTTLHVHGGGDIAGQIHTAAAMLERRWLDSARARGLVARVARPGLQG